MRISLSRRLIAVLLVILTAINGMICPVRAESCFGEAALRARLEHLPEAARTAIVDAYVKCLDGTSWSTTLDASAKTGAAFAAVAAVGAFFLAPTFATFLTAVAVAGLGAAALRALYGRIQAGLAESKYEQALALHSLPNATPGSASSPLATLTESRPAAARPMATEVDRSIPSLDDLPGR